MSETVDDVNVAITGSTTGLATAMEEGAAIVKETTATITESIEGMAATVEAALAPLVALTALFESFSIITEALDKTAELGVQLEVLSQKTGMSVEEISRLKYAADIAHVSVDEFSVGMQRLARGMEETEKGTGPAAEAFKALNINVTAANGQLKPMRDVLLDLATRFSVMRDGAGKTALAMDLFGRSGANLIPFLNQGAAGIANLEKEADRLGVTMDGKSIAAAVAYEEAMKNLHEATQATERQLVLGLMPALSSIASAMTDGEHSTNAFKVAGEAIGVVFRVIASTATLAWTQLSIYADVVKNLLHGQNPWPAIKKDAEDAADTIRKIWSEVGEKPKPPGSNTGDAPVLGPKGLSLLDRLREEWNVIKEGQIGTNTDLLALEITFWKEKLAVTERGTKDYIDIHTHLVELETQLNKRTTEEQNKAAKQVQDAWVATFESIPKAWESAVSSLKNTTAGWGDFFRAMLRDLAVEYAAFEARQIVIHNAAWLEKRKADIAGFLFGKLLLVEQTIVVVAQYAIQAAAAAWAAISGIPIVGPILAPVVALATLAGVLALAHGAGGGGGSAGASSTASAPSGAPSRSVSKSSGDTYIIHTMDAKSFHDYAMANGATIAKAALAGGNAGVRSPGSPGRGSV